MSVGDKDMCRDPLGSDLIEYNADSLLEPMGRYLTQFFFSPWPRSSPNGAR